MGWAVLSGRFVAFHSGGPEFDSAGERICFDMQQQKGKTTWSSAKCTFIQQ